MVYRTLEPVSKQLTIVVGLTVVGFMAFGLALSFYRNLLFEGTLMKISQENVKLAQQIDDRRDQLEYYQSAQYKDKYAKQNLRKLNPGERVLIISEDIEPPDLTSGLSMTPTETQEVAYEETLRQMPTVLHWKLYLFERDRIDELKRGL